MGLLHPMSYLAFRLDRRFFMYRDLPFLSADVRTRAAWQTQVAVTRKVSRLLPTLIRQRQVLFPYFAETYRQLRALPRRVRRHLQRDYRQSLAGVALLLTLSASAVLADTITVDGTTCTLINAIITANTDKNTGHCVQTPTTTAGADTIVLQAGSIHTLTAVQDTTYGDTGLPVVSSELTIAGNNSTIMRSGASPTFRILAVGSTGDLTLMSTTISGGVAIGTLATAKGGGILNYSGTVTLLDSTVSGNSAGVNGGGLYNSASSAGSSATMTLANSTVSDHSTPVFCGGVEDQGSGAGADGVGTVRQRHG